MKEEKIISALIGLLRACENNPKTEETDRCILMALSAPVLCPELDDAAVEQVVWQIHTEKNVVSPGCAQCSNPCGNTADYEMSRIENAESAVRIRKQQILKEAERLAAFLQKKEAPNIQSLEQAVLAVSYERTPEELDEILAELKRKNQEESR